MPDEDRPPDETPTGAVPAPLGEQPAFTDPRWFPAGAPVVAVVPESAPEVEASAPRRKRTNVAVVVLSAVLAVVLVGSGLAVARMISTTHAWERSSADWQKLAQDNANHLATTQSELAAAQADLDTTSSQLATATARITELADEKAQLGDTSATQQQLADYQARVSQAAGQVATALASCITGQQKLIGYLQEAESYDATQLAQFGQDVQTVCGKATDANAALQAELSR